jgi:hypothetical protein
MIWKQQGEGEEHLAVEREKNRAAARVASQKWRRRLRVVACSVAARWKNRGEDGVAAGLLD